MRSTMMLVLALAAVGCGDDGADDTTTGVGDDTTSATSTSTSMTTSTTSTDSTSGVTGMDSSSGGASSGETTAGPQTTSGSGSSDGPTSGFDSTGGVQTDCGGELCDTATQICVERAKGGPSTFGCEPVPDGCDEDRTCACVGATLCTVGLADCSDVADNTVFCDSGLD